MHDPLLDKARRLATKHFLGGGPPERFSEYGRTQLIALLRQGLYPSAKLLDVGCGCLRAGYWLIHFLDPGCYCGIEPNRTMLQNGIDELLSDGTLEAKRPRFDHNDEFDFSVFGEKFDFFLARSIWTHAPKSAIETMLDGLVAHGSDGAVFLTSYKPPVPLVRPDYKGSSWVGASHESDKPGIVRHSYRWIEEQCRRRGLTVRELREDNFGSQRWLRIDRTGAPGGRS